MALCRLIVVGAAAGTLFACSGTAVEEEEEAQTVALAADDHCAVGDEACALSALQLRAAAKAAVEANASDAMSPSCKSYGCYGFLAWRPCQCNPMCSQYGNCCEDYAATCQHIHAPSGGTLCYGAEDPKAYSLNWEAEGDTFFEKFTFVTQDDVHGAHQFTTREEAEKEGVISTKNGRAQLRFGGLREPSYDGEAWKRYSVNIHTNEAWHPKPGFIAVLHYTHLPHGCGIWPSFWAMNSDKVWPAGGELDILEFANNEQNKVTFHMGGKCKLDKKRAAACAPKGHTTLHSEDCETSYFEGKLGCMAYQRQPTGGNLAALPGVIAAEWTDRHITIYHIPEAEIPMDLRNDQPRPENWARWVIAYLPFEPGCMHNVGPQELVLNLQLCGDWAGATWDKTCANAGGSQLWNKHGCESGLSSPTDCCTKFVTSHLRDIQMKYYSDWDIKSLKVYTSTGERSKKSGTFLRDGVPLTA